MFGRRDGADAAKKRRLGIHETTLENDIRYSGPLSTTHFKVLGWLCIVVAQIEIIIRLGGVLDPGIAAGTVTWLKVLDYISDLALPFLLIVNFAQLLSAHEGYKNQLIINGAAMAGICGLSYLAFYRYLVGGLASLLQDPAEALPAFETVLGLFLPCGFFAFNIFVDLFLCTLTMIFLNYNPRRVFVGRARILFRLLALLPMAYEVGCMRLKLNAARGLVQIPVWAFPLLTVKPPMTFVLFVALVLFIKTRELRFRRHGKTHEEYTAFLKTRRNAWNFSVFLAIMMVIVSVADLAVVFGLSLNEVTHSVAADDGQLTMETVQVKAEAVEAALEAVEAQADAMTPEELEAARTKAVQDALHEEMISASINEGIRLSEAVGFGGSVNLILLAPVVLLFSYTRKPKNRLLDTLIPVAGMALIVLVYIECTHQLLGHLPIKKVNLRELRDRITFYMNMLRLM